MDDLKRCKYSDYCVMNQNDDKGFACKEMYPYRECYADADCKYYEPVKDEDK